MKKVIKVTILACKFKIWCFPLPKDWRRLFWFQIENANPWGGNTVNRNNIEFREINTFEGDLEDVFVKVVRKDDIKI